jgi:hypothetical protein
MNWRRGLLRIWLVASIGWMIVTGTYGTCVEKWGYDPFAGLPTADQVFSQNPCSIAKRPKWVYVTMIAAPPLAVLLIGIGAWWAFAGFRKTR